MLLKRFFDGLRDHGQTAEEAAEERNELGKEAGADFDGFGLALGENAAVAADQLALHGVIRGRLLDCAGLASFCLLVIDEPLNRRPVEGVFDHGSESHGRLVID